MPKCPNCGFCAPTRSKVAKLDAGQKKYAQDVRKALDAIGVLERCPYPELREACQAEILRLRIAIGNERKLWAIYRRREKNAIGYGDVLTVVAA